MPPGSQHTTHIFLRHSLTTPLVRPLLESAILLRETRNKTQGASEQTLTEIENLELLEKVGHNKVVKALSEVAENLCPEEDFRPLFDRAYELGYKADWDGGFELNTGIRLRGVITHGLIHTQAAVDSETAVALGHITPEEYKAAVEPETLDEVEKQEQLLQRSAVTMSSTAFNYGWGSAGGTGFFAAVGYRPGTHHAALGAPRVIRWHGVRGGNSNQGGRTLWRHQYPLPGQQNDSNWSRWRHGNGSSSIRRFSFDTNIEAVAAEVGVGW